MSEDHKRALAAGRQEGAALKAYLGALEASKPKRGRKRSPERIESRLADIDRDLAAASALDRLLLLQERRDLQAELDRVRRSTTSSGDLKALEEAFVACAAGFAQRKGIAYQTWREAGVPIAVLKRAGIASPRGNSAASANGVVAATATEQPPPAVRRSSRRSTTAAKSTAAESKAARSTAVKRPRRRATNT